MPETYARLELFFRCCEMLHLAMVDMENILAEVELRRDRVETLLENAELLARSIGEDDGKKTRMPGGRDGGGTGEDAEPDF